MAKGSLMARGRTAGARKLPTLPQADQITSGGLASATRLLHMGLWALVVLGGLGGLKSLVTPAARAAAHPPKAAAPTVGPEGFAELYVATYLSAGEGTEASLRPFYPEAVELREVTSGALYAARTTTVEATAMGERYWSVTVAADVLSSDADGYRPLGNRYYQVAVAGSPNGGFVAASLPAQVPAPLVARPPALGTGSMESPRPGDAVAEAVTRFAAAYLTGNGELVRYTAPDSNLEPVQPAPFTGVRLTRLGSRPLSGPDTGAQQVLAELRATDAAGRVAFLQYALELAPRAGRWEVRAVMPAPPLAAPATDTSTTAAGRAGGELSASTTTTTTARAPAGGRPPAPAPTATSAP
jgi:hypothetical protein